MWLVTKNQKANVRAAILGAGKRAAYLFGPLLQALGSEIELVALWSRSAESARRLGESLGVPWYTGLDALCRATAPDFAVICVSSQANAEVAQMALEQGLHVLLETPIAATVEDADALIASARRANGGRGLRIEVAEQFHRRPQEQLKLKLIASGLFGRVYTAFNDFYAARVHGVSVMRSYLGFDTRPLRVIAHEQSHDLAPHWARLRDLHGPRVETQEHAIIEFEGGATGIYHWTSVGYDSPLRWWRSTRFLAERGMGISLGMGWEEADDRLSLLDAGGEAPRFIHIERRWERVPGGALEALIAYTGDPDLPVVRWDNPYRSAQLGRSRQWHDEWLAVIGCIMSLVDAIRTGGQSTYGALQARTDLAVVQAIRESMVRGGEAVVLPETRR